MDQSNNGFYVNNNEEVHNNDTSNKSDELTVEELDKVRAVTPEHILRSKEFSAIINGDQYNGNHQGGRRR